MPSRAASHSVSVSAVRTGCGARFERKRASAMATMGWRVPPLLKRASFEKLHEPPPNGDYACGWAVYEREWARDLALMHNGSNTMNYFVVWLASKINFAIAIASNAAGENVPKALDDVAAELVRQFAIDAVA